MGELYCNTDGPAIQPDLLVVGGIPLAMGGGIGYNGEVVPGRTPTWLGMRAGSGKKSHVRVLRRGSAPALGAGGRTFKSCHPDQQGGKSLVSAVSAHFYSCFRCGDPLRFFGLWEKITGGRQGLPRTRTTTKAPFRANMFSYRSNSPNACPGTPASIFVLRKLQVLYACPACFPFLCGKRPMCVIHKFVDYFL